MSTVVTATEKGRRNPDRCLGFSNTVNGLGPAVLSGSLEEGGLFGSILNGRSQSGKHPLHRMGLGYDPIDVIAIDPLKRAHFESNA